MNVLVIKILAVGLTLSQLFTKPTQQFKTHFNADADQAQINQLLHDGCIFMTKEFDEENKVDFDTLFTMLIGDGKSPAKKPTTPATAQKASAKNVMDQIDLPTIYAAYKQFCKGEKVENSPIKMGEVIDFYNKAFVDLPDPNKLKNLKLPESTLVLDGKNERFTEIYTDNNRRNWVPISEIPDYVQKAFVAAEDKTFFKHNGLDVRGIVRAFATSFGGKGHPQGGSTITQQVVKNLLVGDDLTFERKMREMLLAARVENEKILTKPQILELYLNFVFLGRASWGVEMAAKSYFGKHVKDLSIAEGTILAALTRGPNYYQPENHVDRLQERREYVVSRMKEDYPALAEKVQKSLEETVQIKRFESPRGRAGYYFLDELIRDARERGHIKSLTDGSYVVHSTINRELQHVVETSLEDGLATYEQNAGRVPDFDVEGSLKEEIDKYGYDWKDLLPKRHGKLWDIHWTLATVLDKSGGGVQVGLPDGRVASLNNATPSLVRYLQKYDLVRVRVTEGKNLVAWLRVPPLVQGAVVVLEAKTGRILAMSGGFSYAQSQLNRAMRTLKQPGSTLKPFIYLTGFNLGLQPNTLLADTQFTFPPIVRGGQSWTPRNYDGDARGLVTMRRALEQSLNVPTARLVMQMGNVFGRGPADGLHFIQKTTQTMGIYQNPVMFYPFILGAQETRVIDMAVAYATIANIGLKPTPHFFDSIEQNGRVISPPVAGLQPIPGIDRTAFYQIRRALEGTVERGTAVQIKDLGGFVAGKTGTSNNWNDAWFVGFTNDLVVATWVGYDSREVRDSLGYQNTGAKVALPIAEKILRASFKIYKDKEPLSQPPEDLRGKIGIYGIDVYSGRFNGGTFPEVFRIDQPGAMPRDTSTMLLNGQERSMAYAPQMNGEDNMGNQDYGNPPPGYNYNYPPQQRPPQDYYRPGAEDPSEMWRRQQRQVDPNYFNPYMTY